MTENEAYKLLIRRLWEGEHVGGYEYEFATLEEYTSPTYFGTKEPERALSNLEVMLLKEAVGNHQDNKKWSVQVNDLVGGYIVTTYPHPLSQHDTRKGENKKDRIAAECVSEQTAKRIANLLNRYGDR